MRCYDRFAPMQAVITLSSSLLLLLSSPFSPVRKVGIEQPRGGASTSAGYANGHNIYSWGRGKADGGRTFDGAITSPDSASYKSGIKTTQVAILTVQGWQIWRIIVEYDKVVGPLQTMCGNFLSKTLQIAYV